MPTGIIFKIKRYAIHDGPGIRTTVFFKGCPLTCRWCHNPEGISPHPQKMWRRSSSGKIDEMVGSTISVDELVEAIEKDQLFYDESGGGVTFSGGEPLHQPQFLEAVLAACNHREIHATLDTSGYAPPEVIERILPRLQLVLFDLKIINSQQHPKYTGVSNQIILENLKRIAAGNTPLRIRVACIPGITDGDANIADVICFAGKLETISGVDLLPFHRIGKKKYHRLGMTDPMADTALLNPQRLEAIKMQFESAGFDVSLGG